MANTSIIRAALAIDGLHAGDARAAFEIAAAGGYRGIAFATSHPELNPAALGPSARRHLKAILAGKSLAIESLTAPNARPGGAAGGGLVDASTIDRSLDQIRNTLTLARELGVNTVAMNLGRLTEPSAARPGDVPDSTVVSALRELAQQADALGLTLAVGAEGPSERLGALLKQVDFDRARINLETARLIGAGEDPLRIAETFAGHLGEVTLADAVRAGKMMRTTPVGQGQLPLAELLRLLADQGFDGPLVVDVRHLADGVGAAQQAAAALRAAEF